MFIDAQDVTRFKAGLCDENRLIAEVLRKHFVEDMPETVLDVGAGLGDIAMAAFPKMRAILLDPLLYKTLPPSTLHQRQTGDFFAFNEPGVKTLLFCHSLQFLDSDLQRLRSKVISLAPRAIVTVTNTNQDLLGTLIKELEHQDYSFNAEVDLPSFPPQIYRCCKAHSFTATVRAESFSELAEAVSYLLDATEDPSLTFSCEKLLRATLTRPVMTIDQVVRLFSYAK